MILCMSTSAPYMLDEWCRYMQHNQVNMQFIHVNMQHIYANMDGSVIGIR